MSLLILVFRFLSSFILILLHCSSVLLAFLFWFFLLSVEQKNPLCMCCNYARKTTCLYSYSPFRVSQIQDMYSFNPIQLKTTTIYCTTYNLYTITKQNPAEFSLTLFQELHRLSHDVVLDIFFQALIWNIRH